MECHVKTMDPSMADLVRDDNRTHLGPASQAPRYYAAAGAKELEEPFLHLMPAGGAQKRMIQSLFALARARDGGPLMNEAIFSSPHLGLWQRVNIV